LSLTYFMIKFQLHPFSENTTQVSGVISRYGSELNLNLQLSPASTLVLPTTEEASKRRVGLWQETCVEIFLKNQQSTEYLEYNLSPSGDWNLFFFKDYRVAYRGELFELPMTEVPGITHSLSSEGLWRFDALVPLPKTIPWTKSVGQLEVGLSFVMKTQESGPHYFSLEHLKEKPDFHDPASFKLRI